MAMMKTLNPTHNQVEPLTASMKKNKIAFGWGGSKRASFESLCFGLCTLFCAEPGTKYQVLSTKTKTHPRVAAIPASPLQFAVSER